MTSWHLIAPPSVWPDKNCQMSITTAQKWFHKKNEWFLHLYKNCLRMGKIGANKLLPKALKGCPKYKKSPYLVTLGPSKTYQDFNGSDDLHLSSNLSPMMIHLFSGGSRLKADAIATLEATMRRSNFFSILLYIYLLLKFIFRVGTNLNTFSGKRL